MGTALLTQSMLLVTGIAAARLLGPEQRGYFALITLLPLVLSSLVALGVPNALTYYGAQNPNHLHVLLNWTFAIYLAQVIIAASLQIALLRYYFSDAPQYEQSLAWLALPVSCSTTLQAYGLARLQAEQRFGHFNLCRSLPLFSYFLLLLPFIGFFTPTLAIFTYTWTLGYLSASVVTWLVASHSETLQTHDKLPPGLSSSALIRFGARSFLGSVSPVETLRLDQAAISLALSPQSLGIYTAALSFTNLPRFLSQSIGLIAFPAISSQQDPSAARRTIAPYIIIGTTVSSVVTLFTALLLPKLVPKLLGSDFTSAVSVAQLLLLSSLLISIRRILSDTLRGAGQPAAGSLAELVSWLLLLTFLPWLLQRFALMGVAWSLVIAAGGSLLAIIVIARRPSKLNPKPHTEHDAPSSPRTATNELP